MEFGTQSLGRLGISEEQVEFMDMAERFCRDQSSIAAVREMMAAGEGVDIAAADAICAMGGSELRSQKTMGVWAYRSLRLSQSRNR